MRGKLLIVTVVVIMMLSLVLVGCNSPKDKSTPLPEKESLTKALVEGGYSLVFEDEFEGKSLDKSVWRIGNGNTIRRGAYYPNDDKNVFVEDGNLVIRTNFQKDGALGAGWYTGWVETSSPTSNPGAPEGYQGRPMKYGYYECRCIAPPAEGIWSAFWMMPDNGLGAEGMLGNDIKGTGKDGVEVDVMESPYYQLDTDRDRVIHVIHGDGYGADMKNDQSKAYNVPNMYSEFHTYGVMWTESEYIFYIDGIETYRTPYKVNDETLGVSEEMEYMILSVEVAGVVKDGKPLPGKEWNGDKLTKHWAGNPAANNKSINYDFVVDYVRVYGQTA